MSLAGRAAPKLWTGILLVHLASVRATAQAPSGAEAFGLDPSVRAAGMGRASTAVFWGGDPNYWANPALLGHHRGLRFEGAKTQLVPDLAHDVFFRTSRATVAAAGIGFAFAGRPGGLGQQKLDYGWSIAVDDQGNESANRPPYVILDDITEVMIEVPGIPWELVMGPHESDVFVWDQRDIFGEVVPPSRYRVEIGFVFEPGGTGHVVSDVFVTLALDPAGVPGDPPPVRERPVTWGRVNSLGR